MLLVCVVPVVVCGTLPLLALLIIRHMYTTSVVMVMVTATSTRSTVMYTPCSVAGRVSATGPQLCRNGGREGSSVYGSSGDHVGIS